MGAAVSHEEIVLLQFRYSPFNEKARWALDFKGVPHRRHSLLPGPHLRSMKRLTGQTATPVLTIDGHCIIGSSAILAELERRYPQPPLFPTDPDLRARALALQGWLDDELGPALRTAMFSMVLDEHAYICDMFAADRPWWQRALYRAAYPLGKPMIKKGNGLTGPAAVEAAFAATRAGLDRLLTEVGPSGYLVGDAFTVADLTAASMLAAAANPPDSPMTRPEPMPQEMRDWLALWQDHAAIDWVRRIYARHRPSSTTQPVAA